MDDNIYFLSRQQLLFLIPICAIVGGILVAIVQSLAHYMRATKRDEMEATLKMEMIQRGMSADEIKTILETRMTSGRTRDVRHSRSANV